MKAHSIIGLCAAFALSIASAAAALAADQSPLGKWRTFDPDSGTPKTIVEITETGSTLTGTVVELLDESDAICTKCEGERKNQPLLGMVILWDLKADGDEWSGGTILRAANGKTANASIELSADGTKLEVTGSRGFASRSQTWERVE